ncbi:response regulator [Actinoplanes derwentensis]|uniref:Response regulator receiver domain-containing protein n=1 Tax=Actinoplanes derwentensis TaxID=113562 RepID=A0A1H2AD53_9ACTN|nr:response regulator [Actinoplanes derwentensis]GID88210.1 response regulator [Actinoplanes derwentensis]SDT43888.1 Response regulator receiver domain-containing protein [Actinoplanes derwentensis]
MRTELYRSGDAEARAKTLPTLLLVDDEESVLDSLSMQLGRDHRLLLAANADEALQLLADDGSVAAVISDMRMPGMDGIELLGRIQDDYPDVMRILHTGFGDMKTAIAAINSGGVYRYVPKPATREDILDVVHSAVSKHDHVMAERDMVDTTLRTSLHALFGILEMSSPLGFARAGRIRGLVAELTDALELDGLWELEAATMASQLGAVTLPAEVMKKLCDGNTLNPDEQALVRGMRSMVLPLIKEIPMMENVVSIVRGLAGEAPPPGGWSGLVEGAISVIRTAIEFETVFARTHDAGVAIAFLDQHGGLAPHVLYALRLVKGVEISARNTTRACAIADLQIGMRLASDVTAINGLVLIGRGTVVTEVMLDRLANFSRVVGLVEPVLTAA